MKLIRRLLSPTRLRLSVTGTGRRAVTSLPPLCRGTTHMVSSIVDLMHLHQTRAPE